MSAGCINNQNKIELANCNCGLPAMPPPPYWDDDETKQSSIIDYIQKNNPQYTVPVLDSFDMLDNNGTPWVVRYYVTKKIKEDNLVINRQQLLRTTDRHDTYFTAAGSNASFKLIDVTHNQLPVFRYSNRNKNNNIKMQQYRLAVSRFTRQKRLHYKAGNKE
jgi:hypothetical protein